MKSGFYMFAFIWLAIALPAFSQNPDEIVTSNTKGGTSVFTDNQLQEKSGSLPSKWNVVSGKCIIEKFGADNVISLPGDETKIRPKADIKNLLSNKFEASFEFFFDNGQRYYCRISPYPVIEIKKEEISCGDYVSELPVSTTPEAFTWKKIMVKYEAKQMMVFVNGKLELTINDLADVPDNFSLENWQTHGEKYYVKNISITGQGKIAAAQHQQVILLSPANNAKVYDKNLRFSWKSSSPGKNSKYILSVFEILHGQTPEEAAQNHPVFQKEGMDFLSQHYLSASKSIERGKKYCWSVKLIEGINEFISEVRTFLEESTTPLKFPEPKISCDTNGKVRKGDPCKIVIQDLKGEVEVQRNGKEGWETATKGMEIGVGDRICTGAGGSAVVAFGTSSVALVGENSVMKILEFICTENGVVAKVFIDPGVAHVSVKQLPAFRTDFQVSTPRLTVSVRG